MMMMMCVILTPGANPEGVLVAVTSGGVVVNAMFFVRASLAVAVVTGYRAEKVRLGALSLSLKIRTAGVSGSRWDF